MRGLNGILTLAGVVVLNLQMYVLVAESPTKIAAAVSGVIAQSQPEEIQRKLEELDRLRASNAALQAVVTSLSSSGDIGNGKAQVEQPAAPSGGELAFFPVLPLPGSPAGNEPGYQAFAAPPMAQAKALPEGEDFSEGDDAKQIVAKDDEKPAPGRLLVTPIRAKENGALVYLAFDKVVRVVEVNGRLYGVDGFFEGTQDGVANLNIKGKRISLPLMVTGT